jgi:SAM-dependent methyltransferase
MMFASVINKLAKICRNLPGIGSAMVQRDPAVRHTDRTALADVMATDAFADAFRVYGAVQESVISGAEERLGVRFPDDYRWVLSECGGGWFRGLQIRGLGLAGDDSRFDVEDPPRDPRIGERYVIIGSCRRSGETDGHPAYIAVDRGKGEVVYLPQTPGAGKYTAKLVPDILFRQLWQRAEQSQEDAIMPWDDGNVRGWDRYWERTVADKAMRFWKTTRSGATVIETVSRFLADRGYQAVFIPANGISYLPLALAHQGYQVMAQDISPFACHFVGSHAGNAESLAFLFPVYEQSRQQFGGALVGVRSARKSLLRVKEGFRPGGTLTFQPGDLYAYEPGKTFDVIVDALFAQTQSHVKRSKIAAQYYQWLRPGGVVVLATMNVGRNAGEREAFEAAFTEAGFAAFTEAGFLVDHIAGNALVRHLDSGGKCAVILYSSG